MPLVLAFLSVTNPENPLDKAVEYSIGLQPNTMGSLHDIEKQDEATSRSSTQSQRASKAAGEEQEKTGTPVQASKGERQEQEDSVVTLEGHEVGATEACIQRALLNKYRIRRIGQL